MDSTSAIEEPVVGRKRRHSEQTPIQRALALLVRREHSRLELIRKLVARGVEQEAAEAAVARLASEGWQDDARFAELLVRSRASSGYGPRYIQFELETHGLNSSQISAAMDSFDGDWHELARNLVMRRFGGAGLQDLQQQRKANDLLARRGFDGAMIRAALRGKADD